MLSLTPKEQQSQQASPSSAGQGCSLSAAGVKDETKLGFSSLTEVQKSSACDSFEDANNNSPCIPKISRTNYSELQDSFGTRAHFEIGNFISFAFDDITLSDKSTDVNEPAALSISKQQTLQQPRIPLRELASHRDPNCAHISSFNSKPARAEASPEKQPSLTKPFAGNNSPQQNSGSNLPDLNKFLHEQSKVAASTKSFLDDSNLKWSRDVAGLMRAASTEVASSFESLFNSKDEAILQLFAPDSQFYFLLPSETNQQSSKGENQTVVEHQMSTYVALSTMNSEGLRDIKFDTDSLQVDTERDCSFSLFYATFKGHLKKKSASPVKPFRVSFMIEGEMPAMGQTGQSAASSTVDTSGRSTMPRIVVKATKWQF